MSRVLLTGAGGFVGSHMLEHLLTTTSWQVICTDSFRHKGKTDRLREVLDGQAHWRPRVRLIVHDLVAPFTTQTTAGLGRIDYIIAMASESHVDRSISDPVPFVKNNVDVMLNTLELAREVKPKAVVVVSTDEVYGPEPVTSEGPAPHAEWSPILPSNPYSASKAAQEAIAISYWRTFAVPVVIVNCMNMIGERQDGEKFLPMLIRKINASERVQIHGTAEDIGTRHYLHARNLADAIIWLLNETNPAQFPAHARQQDRRKMSRIADRPDR